MFLPSFSKETSDTISDSINLAVKGLDMKPNDIIALKEKALSDWCSKNGCVYWGGTYGYVEKTENDDGTCLSKHDALVEIFNGYCKNGGSVINLIPKIEALYN